MAWGDQPGTVPLAANPRVMIASAKVQFGAGGAIAQVTGAPGVTVDGASGAYTVTFPTCPLVHINYAFNVQAAAAADSLAVTGVSVDPTGGTAGWRTHIATTGAATDPASGDEVAISFTVFLNGLGL
jgi:hypothetical protein